MSDFSLSESTLVQRTNESLLSNAKDALIVGFEDYINNESSNARIKSSIRNIYAGLELLLKRYVNTFSPLNSHNALLYRKHDHDVNIVEKCLVAIGNENSNTIGWDDIKQRINNYAPRENIDKLTSLLRRIKRIQSVRHEIEHFYTKEPRHILKFSILDSYEIIQDLDKITQTSLGDEVISDKIKDDFKMRIENYSTHRVEYPKNFKEEDAKYITCPQCNSYWVQPLVQVAAGTSPCDMEIECQDCKHKFIISELLKNFIASISFTATHASLKPLEHLHEKVLHILNEKQILELASACLSNSQIYRISKDPYVHDFIIKVYRAIKNGSKFKDKAELENVRDELFNLYV